MTVGRRAAGAVRRASFAPAEVHIQVLCVGFVQEEADCLGEEDGKSRGGALVAS
jgi:hypothetical protein